MSIMAQSVADQAASKTDEALASPVDAFILLGLRGIEWAICSTEGLTNPRIP
jgi:hypothetical protein